MCANLPHNRSHIFDALFCSERFAWSLLLIYLNFFGIFTTTIFRRDFEYLVYRRNRNWNRHANRVPAKIRSRQRKAEGSLSHKACGGDINSGRHSRFLSLDFYLWISNQQTFTSFIKSYTSYLSGFLLMWMIFIIYWMKRGLEEALEVLFGILMGHFWWS